MVALEQLHQDAGAAPVVEERDAGVVEVRVAVVAVAHLLERQVEGVRVEPLPTIAGGRDGHVAYAASASRHARIAASATSSCAGEGSRVEMRR